MEIVLYISAIPVHCGPECTCHYDQSNRSNVFNCSGPTHTVIPHNIPNYTDWMLFDNTDITELCGEYLYLDSPSNVTFISFKHSQIHTICQETLDTILHNSRVKWLDLSYNKMSKIPSGFQEINHIMKLWLQGNPIFCDCAMTWMIDWLENGGKWIVQNYEYITCARGREVGKPIYLLKPYNMGCYDNQAGMWIAIGTTGILIVLMVLAVGPFIRYVDLRWFVYKKLGILIGNPDENEDIDRMEFDAFLSYR